jgi:hypothetical protein
MFAGTLLGAFFRLTAPGGGSAWIYLLLASAVFSGVLAWNARSRARREDPR